MGEEDKLDCDPQIRLDEKSNDFPVTELLAGNAIWEARRSLERERRLLQSMIDGARNYHLVYLDRDFNFVRVNEAYAKTCGYRPNELVGKNHFDLYPHEENEAIFVSVRDSGIAVEFHDKPFVFPDQPERGTTYWDWTLSPVKDASGNVEGLVFSLFERTARRLAEDALRESEKRFHRLFKDDLTGDFLCQPEGKIILCNPAFATIFGFSSPEEAIGTSMIELYVQPEERDSILETLKRQRKLQGYETWRKRRDGEQIYIVENLVGHFTDQGELYEIQGYIFDDTERKKTEEALRRSRDELELRVQERTAELENANVSLIQYNKRLEALNKELQHFTFAASHDLQEPLRKIQTLGNMLITKTKCSLDEASVDYVQRMHNAAARMQKLLDSLLAYSRVSSGTENKKKTNLNKAVEAALSNLEMSIKEKRAVIEIADLPFITADHFQMIQLFQNLISNGLKYQRNGEIPQVRIYLQEIDPERNETCNICVEDNGIGIDAKYIDQIFSPFQRLHGRNEYDGVGMGLSICKKIVERHGGRITVKSEPYKGSTFIVSLPVAG